MICLDTNVVIAFLKYQDRHLTSRLELELRRGDIFVSTIVLCELQYGAANSERRRENDERLAAFLCLPVTLLPFETEDAEEAGEIRAVLEREGRPIGPYDVLIAGQARRRGAILVTANAAEFARVPGLQTQDWTAA